MFNTTLEEQIFEVPESFLAVLPADYPTADHDLRVGAEPRRQRRGDPGDPGGVYIKALIQGSITLFDVDHADRLPRRFSLARSATPARSRSPAP